MHHNCDNCKGRNKKANNVRSEEVEGSASGQWVSDSIASEGSSISTVPTLQKAQGKKMKHNYPVLMTWNEKAPQGVTPVATTAVTPVAGISSTVGASTATTPQPTRDSIIAVFDLPSRHIVRMNDALFFTNGILSSDGKGGITVNPKGDTFTFENRGMYRFVIDTVVASGAPSYLQFKLSYIRDDHITFTFIPIITDGVFSFSTILSIEAGTSMRIVKQDPGNLILVDSVKLQIYSV